MSIRLNHRMRAGTGVLSVWMLLVAGHAAAQEQIKECELNGVTLVAAAGEAPDKQEEGKVEERAVPRMQPGRPAMPSFKGATIEGNKLTATPGYEVNVRQDGVIMLMPVGGGLGATGRCTCSSVGTGSVTRTATATRKSPACPRGNARPAALPSTTRLWAE